jgi:beta-glucosidase
LEGLKQQKDVEITYLDGKDLVAVEKASGSADAVFLLVGYTSDDEGEYLAPTDAPTLHAVLPTVFPYIAMAHLAEWAFKKVLPLINMVVGNIQYGGDRQSMRLHAADEQLALAVAELAGDKLVLGVEASGPVVLPRTLREKAASILLTGYGGSQFGNGLRDVLFGEREPAGRLAYGIVESELDLPDFDMNSNNVEYGRYWGYRMSQKQHTTPAFPFGFGLGYGRTLLDESSLQVQSNVTDRFFTVRLSMTNKGARPSSGVVQIYCGKTAERGENDYERVLVGFARSAELAPDASETVSVQCRLDPIAHWNSRDKHFEVDAGSYRVFASRFEGDADSLTTSISTEGVRWGVKSSE